MAVGCYLFDLPVVIVVLIGWLLLVVFWVVVVGVTACG